WPQPSRAVYAFGRHPKWTRTKVRSARTRLHAVCPKFLEFEANARPKRPDRGVRPSFGRRLSLELHAFQRYGRQMVKSKRVTRIQSRRKGVASPQTAEADSMTMIDTEVQESELRLIPGLDE